jgi:hypothetical protein
LNYFKRLYLWRDTVEPLLILVGDGGWNNMPSPHLIADASKIESGESALGTALLQKFFVDALDQMTIGLQVKARGYKKPTLATLFLLNNYNHILRQIRSPPLNAIFDDGSELKFGKLVKKQLDAYQESWKPCVENLMDVTYVRGGAIKNSLGNGDKQTIKDRFKVGYCLSRLFFSISHYLSIRISMQRLKTYQGLSKHMLFLILN